MGHCWDGRAVMGCVKGEKLVCMIDAKGAVDWRSFCKVLESQCEVGMRIIQRIFSGLFILQVVQP